jgi:hypothetical protein
VSATCLTTAPRSNATLRPAVTSSPACVVTVQQTANNVSTRIGELHVVSNESVTGTYSYAGHADSTVTVGSDASGSRPTDRHLACPSEEKPCDAAGFARGSAGALAGPPGCPCRVRGIRVAPHLAPLSAANDRKGRPACTDAATGSGALAPLFKSSELSCQGGDTGR